MKGNGNEKVGNGIGEKGTGGEGAAQGAEVEVGAETERITAKLVTTERGRPVAVPALEDVGMSPMMGPPGKSQRRRRRGRRRRMMGRITPILKLLKPTGLELLLG